MRIKQKITIGSNTSYPLTINRFGYGSMQLTGDYVWGEPKNRKEVLKILKFNVENGIQFIDTADYYGKNITNRLIKDALYPYPENLLICTKVGFTRDKNKNWIVFNSPENLRTSIENNLKVLKLEQLKLVHLRISSSSKTLYAKQLEAMFRMQQEGKILHVGLSNVSPAELTTALSFGEIATVENAFSYDRRTSFKAYHQDYRGMQEVMDICIKNKIAMIPFWSLQNSLSAPDDKIAVISKKYKATSAQINLAWLLHYNEFLLPIPGTSKLKHLKENINARQIALTKTDMQFLG